MEPPWKEGIVRIDADKTLLSILRKSINPYSQNPCAVLETALNCMIQILLSELTTKYSQRIYIEITSV